MDLQIKGGLIQFFEVMKQLNGLWREKDCWSEHRGCNKSGQVSLMRDQILINVDGASVSYPYQQ